MLLKDVIANNPDNAEAYRLMGIALVQQNRAEEACALFAKAKSLGDENVDDLIQKQIGRAAGRERV